MQQNKVRAELRTHECHVSRNVVRIHQAFRALSENRMRAHKPEQKHAAPHHACVSIHFYWKLMILRCAEEVVCLLCLFNICSLRYRNQANKKVDS